MPVSKNRRRKSKGTASAGRRKKAAPPPVPDRRAMERMMARLAGGMSPDGPAGGEEEALARARDLIYDAWEAETPGKRIGLAKRALEISDLCADAHVLLAEEQAKTLAEARRHYQAGVAAGERALGRQAFERDAGHFWDILETRPYMRARAGLAECLWQEGERAAAIDHYQEMLRLNPNDNQGLRHGLASWLLAAGDHGALEELLAAYDDDVFADWAYARTLLALRKGDESGAHAGLGGRLDVQPSCPRPVDRRHAGPRIPGGSLHAGLTRRGGHLCAAKQGELVGDAGRLAMAGRNRANPPAAGQETALNKKHPVFLLPLENPSKHPFAMDNQNPGDSPVRNPGMRSCRASPSRHRFRKGASSACKERASFAARRTSLVSSAAALSLRRHVSSCHFSALARARESISARRSSSQRASAPSARARSRSYSDRKSHGAHVGAVSGDDQISSSPSTSVGSAPKSSSRIAMRSTVAHGRSRYQ